MSNIDRRYAYYDEGVLPDEGEYGVTYLTLYSSGAGNVYDGWIYDPEDKIVESFEPRTFGYRNPSYPQYCWDDEVVVDLSNAQTRQESSDFAQGRLTSFNTNVSKNPIILQDIDTTAMTEEEREAKATTVLFSAIPLVDDSYIHAEVEISMKMNLSPNNTTGVMRIEAFYILNDNSDRTMRPHPINYYSVSSANEWNLIRLLYWNPALRHEDNNYIGVKLICTGGTAEIGISDDPDYGDAIITMTSAGMTGDNIFTGQPVSLEIMGLEEVVEGYKFSVDDYTVLCTYDTGEVYDVTRLCEFSPAMGTEIVDAETTLVAFYMGLSAFMVIRLGIVESIELIGVTYSFGEYTFNPDDYVVFAHLDNGTVAEITDKCTFDPIMGTTITQDTALTATYEPSWMPQSEFTDTLTVEIYNEVMSRRNNNYGLIYTLYDDPDNTVRITGNANINTDQSVNYHYHDSINIPNDILTAINKTGNYLYHLEWSATGEICGITHLAYVYEIHVDKPVYARPSKLINFENVKIRPRIYEFTGQYYGSFNSITIDFKHCQNLLSSDLEFLKNIEYPIIDCFGTDIPPRIGIFAFEDCQMIDNLNFLENIDQSIITASYMRLFYGCRHLRDITAIKDWDMSAAFNVGSMFYGCESLESISALSSWDLSGAVYADAMFYDSGIKSLVGAETWNIAANHIEGYEPTVSAIFNGTKITNLIGITANTFSSKIKNFWGVFARCTELVSLTGGSEMNTSGATTMATMFGNDVALMDISAIENWDTSNVINMAGIFQGCKNIQNLSHINNWNLSSISQVLSKSFYVPVEADIYTRSRNGINLTLPSLNKVRENVFTLHSSKVWAYRLSGYSSWGWPRPIGGSYYSITDGMFTCVFSTYRESAETEREFQFINSIDLPAWFIDMVKDEVNNNTISYRG